MSGYFRDRYQGVGAIAAHAPAPRSAPAPSVGRLGRTGASVCPQGCFPISDGTCDCPDARVGRVMGNASRVRRGGPRARLVAPIAGRAMGAIDVTGDRDTGAAGGGGTGGGTKKSPLRQILPGVLAPPVRTATPTKSPLLATQPLTMVATAVPAPGYLPPRTPVKANTAGGGAGYSGSPAYTGGGGGGGALTQMAPPDMGPELEMPPPGSAMTGGLPKGAAKIWIALGLAGAAYFGYRHFKKRRRR